MTAKTLFDSHKPRVLATTIASGGDKNTIVDTSTDTGTVNIDKGFPSKFSSPRSADGKSVARGDVNALFNIVSQPEFFQQYMGRTPWDSAVAAKGYPKGAKVWYYDASGSNSGEYVSKTDSNTDTPGSSTNWVKTGTSDGIVVDTSSIAPAILSSVDTKLKNYVTLSGTESISGLKTFTTSPAVPTVEATSANNAKAVNVEMLLASASSGSGTEIDFSKSDGMIVDTRYYPYAEPFETHANPSSATLKYKSIVCVENLVVRDISDPGISSTEDYKWSLVAKINGVTYTVATSRYSHSTEIGGDYEIYFSPIPVLCLPACQIGFYSTTWASVTSKINLRLNVYPIK